MRLKRIVSFSKHLTLAPILNKIYHSVSVLDKQRYGSLGIYFTFVKPG